MRSYFCLFVLTVFCGCWLQAQTDTVFVEQTKQDKLLSKLIIPSTLIISGVLLTGSQTEKIWQKNIRNSVGNDFHNGADDFVQYVPYAQIYLGDIVGLESKNHWFDQTKNILIGGLTTLVITHALKRGVGKERPDASNNHSFSSGHTATAFLGATMLYHEYKDANMVYAASGFLFSTSAGSLRVMNNRHWISDVLAGAGIGMLVGNLIYYIEPLKNWNPFKKSKNLTFSPIITGNELTVIASFQF